MAARLTAKQAAALGLIPEPKKRTTRKALPRDGAVSRCHTCQETFTTYAAEDRHLESTGHHRYESVDSGIPGCTVKGPDPDEDQEGDRDGDTE